MNKKDEKKGRNSRLSLQPGIIVLLASAILIGLLALGTVFLLTGCGRQPEQPKYVFAFLGDGMGINQLATARYWEALEQEQPASDSIWKTSSFDSFPVIGMMSTHNMNLTVTDSAASATAIFTGKKTQNGSLNYNPVTEEWYTPFAKTLSDSGYAVGVISTTSLEHASPAALYANAEDRYDYLEIARQGLSCGWLDFWAAGGFYKEEEALLEEAQKAGFTLVRSLTELEETDGKSLPVLAVAKDDFAAPHMAYEIDRARREKYGAQEMSFVGLVRQAAACLQKKGSFFLFAEAGKIDRACSDGDIVSSMHEVKALDDAVAEALKFYEKHPEETLIVVFADHETGSLRIGSKIDAGAISSQVASRSRFESIMRGLYASGADFSEAMQNAEHYFGIGEKGLEPEGLDALKAAYEETKNGAETDKFTARLCRLKAEKINMEFVSGAHSGQPVPVYALGCGAENFAGMYDNTKIYEKLSMIMGLLG